jgi:excisionase family DNA binding protein
MHHTEPRLTTRKVAALHLGLHVNTIDKMLREGRIASVKIGRSRRILISELDRLTTPTPPRALTYQQQRASDAKSED